MNITFDKFGKYESPILTLANPNKVELGMLGLATPPRFTFNFNALSEMSFTYPYYDGEGNVAPYYDLLTKRRLINAGEFGWWIINSTNENNDGIKKSIEVTCYSLEHELEDKKLNLVNGTYKLYDIMNYKDCILGQILESTGWTIDYVDSDLYSLYRTFEIDDSNVYSFLMNELSQAYQCIVTFDTNTRKITINSLSSIIRSTDIFLGYNNVVKNLNISQSDDELKTCVSVYGDKDLNISAANPTGSLSLYNFSYYKDSNWMSDSLIKAIDNWEALIKSNETRYRNAMLNLINSNVSSETLNTQLVDLEADLKACEGVIAMLIAANETDSETYSNQITTKKSIEKQIKTLKNQIKTGTSQTNSYQEILDEIHSICKMENNFTSAQLQELIPYIIEGTYQDSSIITTSIMSNSEILNTTIELYDKGKEVMNIMSQPNYEISIDSVNYMLHKDYLPFSKDTRLGSTINVEVTEDNYIECVLLSFSLDFSSPTDFSLTFGNRYRQFGGTWTLAELLGKVTSASNKVNWNYSSLVEWENKSGEVVDFINSTLDATRNALVSSSDQSMIIDGSGLRGRKVLSDGSYDDKQMWLTSNILAFTRDNWNTVSLALGEITLPNGGTLYGLAADAIIGKMLIGSELYISNETSSFLIDGDGIKLKVGDDDTLVKLDVTLDGINSTITKNDEEVRSLISQTAEEIRTEVSKADDELQKEFNSSITQTANSIRLEVSEADNELKKELSSSITQTADSINLSVKGVDDRVTSMELTLDGIDFNGFVTFTDLSTKGSTTINGSNITTGKIDAEYIDVSSITLEELSSDLMSIRSGDVYVENLFVPSDSRALICGINFGSTSSSYAEIDGPINGLLIYDRRDITLSSSYGEIVLDGNVSMNEIPYISGTYCEGITNKFTVKYKDGESDCIVYVSNGLIVDVEVV